NEVPSLVELVERKIAAYVNVANCAQVWQYAERYAAFQLRSYCLEYMQSNWDAILDAVGRDRMEMLFDIMLPPMEELEPEEKNVAPVDTLEKCVKQKKTAKKSVAQHGAGGNVNLGISVASDLDKSPVESCKANRRRKSKSNKFVPLTSFMSNKTAATPTRKTSSPWGMPTTSTPMDEEKPLTVQGKPISPALPSFSPSPSASYTFPDAFPLPAGSTRKNSMDDTAPRQRKASVGSHPSASPRPSFSPLPVSRKHILGYDGVEHEQVTTFSLDAFLKQPVRHGTRGKGPIAMSTWSNSATNSIAVDSTSQPKTLKEIQEEEEAAAALEREMKARLADVQKLQEEQEFLEQQRQILAEIEREQAAKAATRTKGD
ncbi:Regulator of chromosome condensation (RCC1), partial [Phytophthora megakarya]